MLSFAKSMFSVGALAAVFTLASSDQAEARYGLRLGRVHHTHTVVPRTTVVYGSRYAVSPVRVGVVTPPVVTRRVPTYVYPAPVVRPVVPYYVPRYYGVGHWHY